MWDTWIPNGANASWSYPEWNYANGGGMIAPLRSHVNARLSQTPAPTPVDNGPIGLKYQSLGGAYGWLGAPAGPESYVPGNSGRYRHYQNGSIYWSPSTGAFEVHGTIRGKWASLGWERSFLGFPTSDEFSWNGGRRSNFQGGYIFWTPQGGAQAYRY